MVHADASHFSSTLSKSQAYTQLLDSLRSLVADQRNWVCNLANASSLLWHMYQSLPSPSSSVNWAGFYVIDPLNPKQLILGPFQGKVACQMIALGKGVCGTVASSGESCVVQDVETFPGHIACDSESRSEVVVAIKVKDRVVGVVDIDCADVNGFDETDREGLEELARVLAKACDW